MLVLLIEDDPLIGLSMAQALTALGHSLMVAASCEEACSVLRASHQVDAVILDLWLNGERAEDLMYEIRAACASVPPVVVYSGQPVSELRNVSEAVEAAAFLQKPSSTKRLIDTLTRAVAANADELNKR